MAEVGSPSPAPPAAHPPRPTPAGRRRRLAWRPLLRALHRDAGYLAVGLTFVYALSGLAVNHIQDWDPNFRNYEKLHEVKGPFPADDEAAGRHALAALGIGEEPIEIYRADETRLDVVFDRRTLHVDTTTGRVVEEGQKPRLLLRAANWLHLNRGKKAWTYVADGYAVFLLFLAVSGLFMLPGRKGLLGRGALLTLIGAAVPVAYVVWSGGP